MRSTLNLYFGEMIDFIVDAGGDVVKFAGDALMAVWRLEAGCALSNCSFTLKSGLSPSTTTLAELYQEMRHRMTSSSYLAF
jgi:hypothetical protein